MNVDGPPGYAVLIPIIAIVMGIGIAMLSLVLDYRKKRDIFTLHHQERMAAIEKGIEVPPLPPEFFQDGRGQRLRTPARDLRRGLVLLLAGGAISAALYGSHQGTSYWWGLVPASIGVASLLAYFIEGRKAPPP